MDVVYNHMYDADASNFQALVPDYYFRLNEDGSYSGGSGCGNETASERSMLRKFIIDSVVYWATEYHIDGFRFDLMALHDIETMNLVRAALDEIDPSIMVYGEGWMGGASTLAPELQATKAQTFMLDSRIAVFSDDIRDGIKGSVFNHTNAGYVNGDPERTMDIRFGITASVEHPQVDISKVSYSDNFWANGPTQTVTYASAHDNLSLWDKLIATNPGATDAELEAQNRLSAAIVLTSQGIPFFQAGEEMARTKQGDENSYRSPDRINQLDWVRKSEFLGLYEYYKGLIALRKATPAFRLETGDEVRENLVFFDTGSDTVVGYTLAEGAGGGDTPLIAVIFNGNDKAHSITLPLEDWDIMVNGESAGTVSLGTVNGVLEAQPKTAYVLFKK
jgi:pullulanase